MLTIFIGTFNRIETLERTVASYNRFSTPHEIVIVDNGTDNQECLEVLARLEPGVKKIYSLPGCVSMEEATDNFNVAIRDQYETDGGKWFAVSEADVCFEGADTKSLAVYMAIARRENTAVGPHLRADHTIPNHYPFRSRVLACETWMQYKGNMQHLGNAFYNKCQTDTTFHLFPRTREFKRLRMDPIRVGGQYAAMHLDWYLDVFNPNQENPIYINGERPVGSWGKQWIRDFWNWWQEDPDTAVEKLLREPQSNYDLCNVSFIISWAFQYGYGCERDYEKSLDYLRMAIPYPNDRYWSLENDWMNAIYNNDHSGVGW